MSDHDFTKPPSVINGTAVPSPSESVIICLVDADSAVYDVRGVFPGDIGMLNAAAQTETQGQLWWETLDRLEGMIRKLSSAHDRIDQMLLESGFSPVAA